MLKKRLQNIKRVLKTFTGRNGEPNGNKTEEKYILKSMWVMLLSELEGSIKDLVEAYIDKIKKGNIKNIHICLLIQNFYGDKEEELTVDKMLGLFNKKKEDITYLNFTKNKNVKQKSYSIEKLYNSLGIFLSDHEKTQLKLLDGITSTRDSIAHGDHDISITRKQLECNIKIVEGIYKFLKAKTRN